MINKRSSIMAKLGRVYGLLEALGTYPEYSGCATVIRKARRNLKQSMSELSETENPSVFAKIVARTTKFLVELFALLAIGWVKDFFNFCLQPLLYTSYGYRY